MSKGITRTLTTSVIKVNEIVMENGVPMLVEIAPITVQGTISDSKANRLARKQYADKQIAVVGIEKLETKYEISLEDFMAHAKQI